MAARNDRPMNNEQGLEVGHRHTSSTENNKMATKNDRPMNNEQGLEVGHRHANSTENNNVASRNDRPMNNEQGVVPHPTISIEWCWFDKTYSITSNKAGTIEDLLKTSDQFNKIAKKQKEKELVIVRGGKAISSHFPCSLIKKERLTVKYVKASDKFKKPISGSAHSRRTRSSQELVMFHVLVKGGKNVVNLMRNPALKTEVQEVTVYAYKGEKVKYTLERDGRFLNIIFKTTCALSNIRTEVTTEMSNLVDDLKGETFRIIQLSKSSPPHSQPSSVDESFINESQQSVDGETSSQQPTTDPSATDIAKCQPKTEKNLTEKPCSQILIDNLTLQINNIVKAKKGGVPKLSRIQNLFRVEYGKNAQICREVKTMKKLMELSSSVCQVRINGSPHGSGFLLFERFVLTNGHVIKDIYNEGSRQLSGSITVHFSFESLEDTEGSVEVEEVVGFECGRDASESDWALLRLRTEQNLPLGLLKHSGLIPQGGGICIIGHPDFGVKKVEPCVIVTSDNHNQVAEGHRNQVVEGHRNQVVEGHRNENEGHVQMVTNLLFEDVAKLPQKQVLIYESCFYFGSSGSPVFDGNNKVVAMHSGGYVYPGPRGVTQSVIEFGHPLSVVVERIRCKAQLQVRKRFEDVLSQLSSEPRDEHNTFDLSDSGMWEEMDTS